MVLTEFMYRTAVWKVPILRWSVLWGQGCLNLLLLDVLWEFQKPEEQLLPSLLFDDVELVVVAQSSGHLLVGHVVSVLVVPPETCQSIWVHHPEHQALRVFPSDVFLVTVITQQLIHIVPEESALWDAAVGFVQRTPRFLSIGQVERFLDDAFCLGRRLNSVLGQRRD